MFKLQELCMTRDMASLQSRAYWPDGRVDGGSKKSCGRCRTAVGPIVLGVRLEFQPRPCGEPREKG
jgi:hypothetical protein